MVKNFQLFHITVNGYPAQGSISVYEYSQSLSQMGYQVNVICFGTDGQRKKINGVKVWPIFVNSKSKNIVKKILFSLKTVRILKKLVDKNNSVQLIHVYHFIGAFLLPLIVRRRKLIWVLDIRSGGISSKTRFKLAKMIFRFEKTFFDKVIFIDQGIADYYHYKNASIVPLGANFNFFKRRSVTEVKSLRKKYDFSE